MTDALFPIPRRSQDRHGWPDYDCACGRAHCGDCGDIYPCRWHLLPCDAVKPAWALTSFQLIDWSNPE